MASKTSSWLHVGSIDDFPVGSKRILQVGKHEIGIYNVDGELYAVRNYCPHRGAPICMGTRSGTMLPAEHGEYIYGLEGRVLHCPWHQWAFDIESGQALFGIDRSRLICHTVECRGDEVYLDEHPRRKRRPAEGEVNGNGAAER